MCLVLPPEDSKCVWINRWEKLLICCADQTVGRPGRIPRQTNKLIYDLQHSLVSRAGAEVRRGRFPIKSGNLPRCKGYHPCPTAGQDVNK